MNQLYVHVYPVPLRPLSYTHNPIHLGHHRALNWSPCTTEQVPTRYLFYNGTLLQYLAWKIPWMEEPGELQSMGSLRVEHDWATSLSLFTLMHWKRKWQPTPAFLPWESQGRGSLVGCWLWGHTESDTTKAT